MSSGTPAPQLPQLPNEGMKILAMSFPVVALVLWIAAGSAGVGAMDEYKTKVTASKIANTEDLQTIAQHMWTGQVVSLVCSILLALVFAGLTYWVWKTDKKKSTDKKLILNLVVGGFGLLLCVATTSALIDGTTDLYILSETQAASGATGGTEMVTESTNARNPSIGLLSVGVAVAVAAAVAVFFIRKKKTYFAKP